MSLLTNYKSHEPARLSYNAKSLYWAFSSQKSYFSTFPNRNLALTDIHNPTDKAEIATTFENGT